MQRVENESEFAIKSVQIVKYESDFAIKTVQRVEYESEFATKTVQRIENVAFVKTVQRVEYESEFADPMEYWRNNHASFPLLAKYFMAYSSFQPTSVASERVFNIDGLVMSDRRKSMDPERHEDCVIVQDYLKRRENPEAFKLCSSCPQHPSVSATYKSFCQKHNA